MGVFILGIHMGKGFCELMFWQSVIVLGCELCSGSVSGYLLEIYLEYPVSVDADSKCQAVGFSLLSLY